MFHQTVAHKPGRLHNRRIDTPPQFRHFTPTIYAAADDRFADRVVVGEDRIDQVTDDVRRRRRGGRLSGSGKEREIRANIPAIDENLAQPAFFRAIDLHHQAVLNHD
jgi:hypothetical protein